MNKKKRDNLITVAFLGLFGLIFCIFLALHSGMTGESNFITGIIKGVQHMLDSPMTITFHPLFFTYIGYYVLFLGLALFCYYLTMDNSEIPVESEPGKAKFYTDMKEFKKQFGDPNPCNEIILSQTVHMSMNSSKTMRNNNVLVIGGSGSGKTRFMIKPNIMQANCSFVVTDPKGEILQKEGMMLRNHGYKIKVFNLVDMAHSNSYNPFEYIRDDLGVLMMINCLIKNTNNGQKGGDPFWEKSETALLQALVFYLKNNPDIPKEFKNFSNVMKLLRAAEVNENDPNAQSPLDKLFTKEEARDPNSIAVKQYKTFKMGAGKTLKSILISCAVRLTVFNLPEIASLTVADDLELQRIGDEKTALFVVIPAADDTYNFLVSMMYSQLFETLYYRAENECSYEYYIKEGTDVLAIARKNPKGDASTHKDAENLLRRLKQSNVKQTTVNGKKRYTIKTKDFTKEFFSKEAAEEYKSRLTKATIVKGAIRLPYPVRFLLDEFANIGQIPDFTKKLATMRQYEISCTIVLQNMAQIKNLYDKDYGSIIGNCDSFLFLGGQEVDTLKYISELLGKRTVRQRSKSKNSSAKGGSSGTSESLQQVDLMSINELSTMSNKDCVSIIRGLNPFKTKKYDLTKHPHFKETGDFDSKNDFDCKSEIFNHSHSKDQGKPTSQDEINKGVDLMLGKRQTLDETLKDAKVNSIRDAVDRIVLKKGEVIVNEKENKGKIDFDYNLE